MTEDRLRDIEERLSRLEGEVQSLSLRQDLERKDTVRRLDSIEDNTRWLLRLVIGGLIMAVLGFMIQGGFNAP